MAILSPLPFLFSHILPVFWLWVFLIFCFSWNTHRRLSFLPSLSIRPSPLLSHLSSSLLHTRISCLRRPETAQLFSSSPEPLCWTCLDLFSASSQSSRTLKMTDEVRLAWEGRNRISYPKTMLIHNWPSNRCVCVCVCFLLRRTPKPASLIAQPAFHYVFKLPMHEEDEASEIYMFRLVAGGTRVYEVVLFPSGTSCSLWPRQLICQSLSCESLPGLGVRRRMQAADTNEVPGVIY